MEVALLYFVVLAAAFFLLIVRPQRRRVSAHRAFVESLTVGHEVITTGGIFGVIRELDGEAVSLEVAPGIVVRVARAAIGQPVPADDGSDVVPGDAPDEA
jgi:preprotein translocase subunit YajC